MQLQSLASEADKSWSQAIVYSVFVMGTGYEELHVGDKVEDKSQRFSSIFEQTISWKVRRLSSAYHKYYVWSSKLQAAFVLELIRYKGFMTCATLRQYLGIIVECVHKHNLIAQSQAVAPGETSLSYINTWSIRCLWPGCIRPLRWISALTQRCCWKLFCIQPSEARKKGQ